jgi:Formin Homology 2 Domain/Subunit CCDC53 of WASH complex
MKKRGLSDGAVRNAMIKDGLDPSILDLDQNITLSSQRHASINGTDIPLQDDPAWSKYFTMLKMGLPLGAAKNAVERDGKDSSVLDLDPSQSIHSQRKVSPPLNTMFHKKKKPVKRKKIYWNPLNSGQIKANSLWSHVKGRLQMSQLKYDEKEFADLFTETADPADKANLKSEKQTKSKAKKSVQVIDGKRSMNGGIILARLRLEYGKIAEMVDNM